MRARVALTPTFTLLGRDTVLTDANMGPTIFFSSNYDVSRDGKRILAVMSDANDFRLVIAPNWITEFRRRLAESRGAAR